MKSINGINVSELREFKSKVEESPDKAQVGFHITSRWKGRARMEAEVNASFLGGKKIERSFTIASDEPTELLGENSAANPQELLMAAVNACMMVGYVAGAADRGIKLQKLEIDTRGQLDLRGFLGTDSDVPAGYRSIDYVVTVQADRTTVEELQELHEHVRRTSPNYFNMTNVVEMNGKLVVEDDLDDITRTPNDNSQYYAQT